MVNRSKQRGTAWESAVRDYLHDQGWPNVERLALSGNKDRGDLIGIPGLCLELKNTQAHDLAGWSNEVRVETANAGATIGAAWAKRRAKTSPADGYVLLDGATFVRLLREAGY